MRTTLRFADGEMHRAGGDELLDGTGGELAFSPARQALCASTAYVALGDAQSVDASLGAGDGGGRAVGG